MFFHGLYLLARSAEPSGDVVLGSLVIRTREDDVGGADLHEVAEVEECGAL
jgi:hypothetical protein